MCHKSSLYSCFFLYIGEDVKPFTPEKTKEIVMSLQQPAVFCDMVGDWPALHWNAKYLSAVLDGKTIQFRLGLKTVDLGETEVDRCYMSQLSFLGSAILCLSIIIVHSLRYCFSLQALFLGYGICPTVELSFLFLACLFLVGSLVGNTNI